MVNHKFCWFTAGSPHVDGLVKFKIAVFSKIFIILRLKSLTKIMTVNFYNFFMLCMLIQSTFKEIKKILMRLTSTWNWIDYEFQDWK